MLALCLFFFGFFSSFSGQQVRLLRLVCSDLIACLFVAQLFHDAFYQLFSVAFTALPPLFVGVFDRLLERKTLQDHPAAYQSLREKPLFGPTVFAQWIFSYACCPCRLNESRIVIGCAGALGKQHSCSSSRSLSLHSRSETPSLRAHLSRILL